jgi:hypothetical protein
MDWSLAKQIRYPGQGDIAFASHINLPQFPTDNFRVAGFGLTAVNPYQLYLPIHGKVSNFESQKVLPPTTLKQEVKEVQQGSGPIKEEEDKDDVEVQRTLKRKALGDNVFELMSKPQIKTVKFNVKKTEGSAKKVKVTQKGKGGGDEYHIF